MRSFPELIAAKRDGLRLNDEEIRHVLAGAVDGSMADYQVSALLMAIYFNGMEPSELATFTAAMVDSGERLSIDVGRPLVDKHSTGGVGDKISLALAPLVAACGVAVPMMSGRGLGHTGGTLDKLESVPGLRTDFSPAEFARIVDDVGCIVAGQSASMVPADRLLYGLRDTTATVASIPLIASSIMSKKLAEGIDALVLDIKVGTGAFMGTVEDARQLAEAMWSIGTEHGVATECVLTRMDDPLGNEVGNANELREAIDVVTGNGPADVTELVHALGSAMLAACGIDDGPERLRDAVTSGTGADVLGRMVEAQGGDPAAIGDPEVLPRGEHAGVVEAQHAGTIQSIDSLAIGMAGVDLGAGRTRTGDAIDHGAGTTLLARRGDSVEIGQPLAEVRCSDRSRIDSAMQRVAGAFTIGDEPAAAAPLIIDRYNGPA